jgi:hypothetical protein
MSLEITVKAKILGEQHGVVTLEIEGGTSDPVIHEKYCEFMRVLEHKLSHEDFATYEHAINNAEGQVGLRRAFVDLVSRI